MKKQTRKEKTKKMIFDSLNNLFKNQTELSFDEFVLVILEVLMLLEREEYLKSHAGAQDSGNGSYLRSFTSLSRNRLQINIPRSRNGRFKPVTIDLIKQQAEQIRQLGERQLLCVKFGHHLY